MKPALGLALFLAGVVAAPAGAAETDALARETREHLKALVRLDTSNPPRHDILAARSLKAQLD